MTARRQPISEGCQELTHYTAAHKHTLKHARRKKTKMQKLKLSKEVRIKHVTEKLSKQEKERDGQIDRGTDGQREWGPYHSVSHPTG